MNTVDQSVRRLYCAGNCLSPAGLTASALGSRGGGS